MRLVCEAIEGHGVPTVTLAMEPDVGAPRVARVPFPYNFPMGREPGHRREIALEALALLYRLEDPAEIEIHPATRET